jgi:predicted ATPase
VLLLAGIPGIGKSRLLREAARLGSMAGWTVLAGGCTRSAGQEPFAPLAQALRQFLASLPSERRRSALAGAAWLVRLLPELADALEEILPRWTLTPGQDRRLVCEAVACFLRDAGGPRGTLLLLDDLQWADADAVDLLATLVRASDGRLRLVGAYRDTEVMADGVLAGWMADLASAGLADHRVLLSLSDDENRRLLDCLLVDRQDIEPGVRDQLARRSGGVPFFTVSCAQALPLESGRGDGQDDRIALPWDVRQSVRQRVTALPESAQEVLRAAAVVGREAERRVLAAITGLPRDHALDALDRVCRARLLEEQTNTQYRFVHDIVREVVEGDLSAARRAYLHQRTAETLEMLSGTPPVTLLAYHYAQSDAVEKALQYLEQAGDHAMAQLAGDAAERYYSELAHRLESAGRTRAVARAYGKLGLLLQKICKYAESIVALQRAADLYGRLETSSYHQALRNEEPDGDTASVQMLLSQIEQHESPAERGALYLAQGSLLLVQHRAEDCLLMVERAVDLSRQLGDTRLRVQAQVHRTGALRDLCRLREALATGLETLRLCTSAGEIGLPCCGPRGAPHPEVSIHASSCGTGIGWLMWKPWPTSQPSSASRVSVAASSMPSATTDMPRL